MKIILKLAFRFLFSRKKSFFKKARFFTIFTIGISVAALLVSLSAFRGYENILMERYSDSTSHIIVSDSYGDIKNLKFEAKKILGDLVDDLIYFGYIELIVSSQKGVRGLVFEALQEDAFDKVIKVKQYMKSGSTDCIYNGIGNVVLGYAAAKMLSVDIGDSIRVLHSGKEGVIKGGKELKVCGLIDFGLYDLDSRMAFISIRTGNFMFPEAIFNSSLKIRLKDDKSLSDSTIILRDSLPPGIKVRSWVELNYSMFEAIRLDRIIIFFILSILVAVAVFNVISTLIILGKERQSELSMLAVLGFNAKKMRLMVFYEAIIMGTIGYAIGIILWGLALFVIQRWSIIVIPEDIYLVSKIPTGIGITDLLQVFIVVIAFVSVAAIFPAMFFTRKRNEREGLGYAFKSLRP